MSLASSMWTLEEYVRKSTDTRTGADAVSCLCDEVAYFLRSAHSGQLLQHDTPGPPDLATLVTSFLHIG